MENQQIIKSDKAAIAVAFTEHLQKLTQEKSRVYLALSGGSTPNVLFKLWAEDYRTGLPWDRIHFFWGDERCVPPDHADSNFRTASELFLSKLPIPAQNIHRIHGEDDPEKEAERYSHELKMIIPEEDGFPVFDLIMLGMGDDGHTASIFPHQMELLESDAVCGVATHPISGQIRVTLTGKTINKAKEIAFLVTGAGKKEKVTHILGKQEGYEQFPAAHIQPPNGQVYWFMDEAAAAGLSK